MQLVAVLPVKIVEDKVRKAAQYSPPLDRFIVATSAPSDAKLQAEVQTQTVVPCATVELERD